LGLIRFLLILFVGIMLLRTFNVLAAWFREGYGRKDRPRQDAGKSPGRMTIDLDPRRPKGKKPKVGEYVDFEDIKD
jgi:hypothetical protein